ncbi:hypothetical protein [Williamsia sp.]|uniref:hypothetical protein n=1 Tax=Williamsia sp. TaxID=1872085 RepID=UPI001A241329|nr:hypothetical protein [Williamsia sp.]MBJ7287992.1 hypothetical protein [Williamsia sp.]
MNPDIFFEISVGGVTVGAFEGRAGGGVFRGEIALSDHVEPFEDGAGYRKEGIEVSYPAGSDPFTVVAHALEMWRSEASHLRGWPL